MVRLSFVPGEPRRYYAQNSSQHPWRTRMVLRLAIIAYLMISIFVVVRTGIWQSDCRIGGATFTSDLPPNPIWDPPALPTYESISSQFDLPIEQPDDCEISMRLRWGGMLLEFAFYMFILSTFLVCVFYHPHKFKPSRFLHATACVTISILASCCLCFVLWLIIGGWGPPVPILFILIGFVVGIYWGCLRPLPDNA